MKKLPRLVALAAASTLALGSTACITIDRTSSEDEDSTENGDEAPEEEEDSDLDALVGVWEYEDPNSNPNHPGPDSELTVDEDGNAIYVSSGNIRGDYEGPIVDHGNGELIFEGSMELEMEELVETEYVIIYNEDDDTMTMSKPDDEDRSDRVHDRTE